MIPKLKDLETGEEGEFPDFDFSVYWWTEGNGACDCNRSVCLGKANEMEERMCVKYPELKSWQGVCYGCKRFIAVDVRGDLEGYTKEQIVQMMNLEYPNATR